MTANKKIPGNEVRGTLGFSVCQDEKINFNAKKMGVLVQMARKHFQLLYGTGVWKGNPVISTSTEECLIFHKHKKGMGYGIKSIAKKKVFVIAATSTIARSGGKGWNKNVYGNKCGRSSSSSSSSWYTVLSRSIPKRVFCSCSTVLLPSSQLNREDLICEQILMFNCSLPLFMDWYMWTMELT